MRHTIPQSRKDELMEYTFVLRSMDGKITLQGRAKGRLLPYPIVRLDDGRKAGEKLFADASATTTEGKEA